MDSRAQLNETTAPSIVPDCRACVFAQMRDGDVWCTVADDVVVDVINDAMDCPEFTPDLP